MDDFQSLTSDVTRLNTAVDWWNSAIIVMMVVAAVAATGLLFTQYIAFQRAGQLAEAQSRLSTAKETKLTADSREKDVQIAALRIKAGEAEAGISSAQADAASAQQKATEATAAQQIVQTELARQQAKAADAERSLLELQERIKPRRLTDQQGEEFLAALRVQPHGVIDLGYTPAAGDDGFNFLKQILPLFKNAGWTVRNEVSVANHFEIQVIGIGILARGAQGPDPTKPPPPGFVALTPTLGALRAAFASVGIQVEFINWHPGEGDIPEVVVGSKPQP